MQIVKMELINFKNHKHCVVELKDKINCIVGMNATGKSSILSGARFLLTPKNKIFSNQAGVNENDTETIISSFAQKGEHTSVSAWFEDGTKFTKVYKTGYDRQTGKANKHTCEGLINDVGCKNMTMFHDELNEKLNYKPYFKRLAMSSSFDEIDLLTNSSYLQILEPKVLRSVLEELGCKVANEEVYSNGYFEDIKSELESSKYSGDAVKMRDDYKKKLIGIKESYNSASILFNQFSNIREFDDSSLIRLQAEKKSLEEAKIKAKNTNETTAIAEIDLNIKELFVEKETAEKKFLSDVNLEITSLESKIKIANDEIINDKKNKTADLYNDKSTIEKDIINTREAIASYDNSLSDLRIQLNNKKILAESTLKDKSNYAIKRTLANDKTYTEFVVCPCCDTRFPISQKGLDDFNKNKEEEIKMFDDLIIKCDKQYAELDDACKNLVLQGKQCKDELAKLDSKLLELERNLALKKKEILDIEESPADMTKVTSLTAELLKVKNKLANVTSVSEEFASKIKELETKKIQLSHESDSVIEEEVTRIESQIENIESQIEDLYILRSKVNSKAEYKAKLDNIIMELNNVESTLAMVNGFIHKRIELLNGKASKKIGIDFVMLEENLGNDGIREVCYAVENGVPFASLNTARQVEIGIKFIEKVKTILELEYDIPRSDLPILADKLEGFDFIEKIKGGYVESIDTTFKPITQDNLLCTIVAKNKNIEII